MIGDYVLFGFAQTVVSTIGYTAGCQQFQLSIDSPSQQSTRPHEAPTTCLSPFDQTLRDTITRYYKE